VEGWIVGAWGLGSFDNDAAMDWLARLKDSPDPTAVVRAALAAVTGGARPAERVSVEGLAACELVAAVRGHGLPTAARLVAERPETLRSLAAEEVLTACRSALAAIVTSSELRERWREAGEDAEWRADVQSLQDRLTAATT
jgi:hypothetical protein